VIDVRVSEQNGIDRGGREWGFCPIPFAQLARALKESAINQDPLVLRINKIF
jgi:hypothetical protein